MYNKCNTIQATEASVCSKVFNHYQISAIENAAMQQKLRIEIKEFLNHKERQDQVFCGEKKQIFLYDYDFQELYVV